MTQEIIDVIAKHELWLAGSAGGIRANLRGANLRGANLSEAILPDVVVDANLAAQILERVAAQPTCLDMKTWHTCETTHCLAGWAVTLHTQGKLLESMIGTNAAGALIFNACCKEVPDFYDTKENAIDWLRSKTQDKERGVET